MRQICIGNDKEKSWPSASLCHLRAMDRHRRCEMGARLMLQISSLPARLHMMQQETSPATGLRRPTLTMQGIASSQRSGYTYTYDGDGNRVKKATGSSGT